MAEPFGGEAVKAAIEIMGCAAYEDAIVYLTDLRRRVANGQAPRSEPEARLMSNHFVARAVGAHKQMPIVDA